MTAAWFIILCCCLAIPVSVWFGIQIGVERERDRRHVESVRRK